MNKIPSSFYTIRFSDCDPLGHLNNGRYIDYFLNAREDHLQENYQLNLKDFYYQGISWVVNSHEITYLRPADYTEKVKISSRVLNAATDHLLVEMRMTDENETHLKALMWTKFVPINIKTGKRENHSASFMEFAKSVETNEFAIERGYKERLREIIGEMRSLRV
jgi:YbgC/YbaW family acyl-CoA thioester hydrolase